MFFKLQRVEIQLQQIIISKKITKFNMPSNYLKNYNKTQNLSFSVGNQSKIMNQQLIRKNKRNEHRNGSQIIEDKINAKHKRLSSLVENFDIQNLQKVICFNSPLTNSTLKNKMNFPDTEKIQVQTNGYGSKISQSLPLWKRQTQKFEQNSKKYDIQTNEKMNMMLDFQCKKYESYINSYKAQKGLKRLNSDCFQKTGTKKSQNDSNQGTLQNQQDKQQLLKITQTSSCVSQSFIDYSFSINNQQISVEDFTLIKKLGEGSYGKVALYKHNKSNFICAIKQILKSQIHQQAIQYLIRQIKTQTFLSHSNIVNLYTFFQDQKAVYIVMEPCTQGNLYSKLVKKGKLSEKQVKKIMKQLCSAVNYMHNLDIMHRDIKPQNILVHDGVYKICDFGWAIQVPLSRGTLCGTAIYSSPQLVQECQYDTKVDIWNLGVMAYELIVGKIPFQIKQRSDLNKILTQNVTFPSDILISTKCKSFILKCLEKDPRKRCSIKHLIDHDFLQ